MNIRAWHFTCNAHPPAADVAGMHPEVLANVTFTDEQLLPLLITCRRFGAGVGIWPEALPSRKAFNAALS